MADAGVLMVSFTGGEPLVRDDIDDLVEHVAARGMVCKLNTNGQLLRRHLPALRSLDILQISLDGPPAVHDRLRGAGTSERAAAAVRLARRSGIPVHIVACLTRDVVDHLDDVLELARTLDVKVHFQPLASPTDAGSAACAEPSRDELRGALLRLRRETGTLGRRRGVIGTTASELTYYLEQLHRGEGGCHCALVTGTVLPDGGLIFCGNGRVQEPIDTNAVGFATAFSQLSLPVCDGCTCVGKLRTSRVFQLDPRVLLELVKL